MKHKPIFLKIPIISLGFAALTTLSQADLIGHWAFDEGTGTTTADSSGLGNDGIITEATWGTDEVRGSYLIFDGVNDIVDPLITLPVMTDTNEFSWALWVNSQEAIGATQQNAVLIGNRYDASGLDFVPRQFVKITPTKFEWHQNGNGNDNLDVPDLVVGEWHHIAVVKTGTVPGTPGFFEYYFDGISVGTKELTEIIGGAALPLFIGGQANTTSVNEFFNGYLDDVRIYDQALTQNEIRDLVDSTKLAPVFPESAFKNTDASAGVTYAGTISGRALDPNTFDTITYSKLDGPAWLTVNPDGALGGTPASSDAGYGIYTIEASDGELTATATLIIPVIDPAAPPVTTGLFGRWPLDDGTGNIGSDISGNHLNAFITNPDTGGLGLDGSAWAVDPEFGTVLSFNGDDGTGSFATVGLPPFFGTMPALTLDSKFTWSLWTKSDEPASTSLVLGNRYNPEGAEYTPREFIKFTSAKFEFDTNAGQGFDYDDLLEGAWIHHVVVMNGSDLTYYRDGALISSNVLTQTPVNELPIYFGGFGAENWRGYLSDVRLYERALTEAEVTALYEIKANGPDQTISITDISVAPNRNITLTWTSRPGATYLLDASTGLADEGQPGGWQNVEDAISSGGDTTTWTMFGSNFPFAATESKLFFRIRQALPN